MRSALLIPIAIALLSFVAGNTFSYFRDVEVSSGNTLQAGIWSQSDYCLIDVSNAKLTNCKLHDIFIQNVGKRDITITKLVLQWNCGGNLTKLKIGNQSFTVNQASPAIIRECIEIKPKKYPASGLKT